MKTRCYLKTISSALLICVFSISAFSQGTVRWKAHDLNRPSPRIIIPPAQYLPIKPPSDAIVLFSGGELSKWESTDGSDTKWISRADYFECVKGSGYIRTKEGFGDVQLHVEWAAPLPVKGKSQGRGNSGVFLMGRYEVQVLDSYKNETYADGQAAAIYGQSPPMVNASRPPGEWQSYDIIFRRPRFDNLGMVVKPARMTVIHNGVLVQDNVELWGGTEWLKYSPYKQHADKLPLALQDHGNPVRFRNIWLRELAEEPAAPPVLPPVVALGAVQLKRYVGTYTQKDGKGKYEITLQNGSLFISPGWGRSFELLAHSKVKFSTKFTAIDINFALDSTGNPTGLSYKFTGSTTEYIKATHEE